MLEDVAQALGGGRHEGVRLGDSGDSGRPEQDAELVRAHVEEGTLAGAHQAEDAAEALAPFFF